MRPIKLLATAILAIGATCAQATVLDFEDLSGQDVLPSNYAGLTWGSGWGHYDWPQYPFSPASGVQRLYNSFDDDWFKFASDVVFNGAFFAGYDKAKFELYDDGVLVHTSSTLYLSDTATFLASGYTGLVDEVRLNVLNGYFVIDDITFDAQVPEPLTLSLFGVSLAALACTRRRPKH